MIDYQPQSDDELRAMLRVRGEADLYFFITEILELGYNPKPDGPRVTEDQRELCEWLQSEWRTQKRFVLAPRDTLKSTCLEGYVLWRLVKNPDLRVLLYGEVHEQAQKRLAKIKRLIQNCRTFRFVYGDLTGPIWNENMITLASRQNPSIREANIETAGLDVVVNARHFDLIVPDDLHSEKNSKTKDMIDQVEEKIDLLEPLLDKDGHMLFAGVFWSDNDAHVRLIEKGGPDVEVYKRSIWIDDDETKGPRYPHQLPLSSIERKRRSMRKDLFACHYLLDPVPKEDAVFRQEYFTKIPYEALPKTMKIFIVVDPAGDPTSEQEARRDSDNVGIVVIGVPHTQDLIFLDAAIRVMSPTEAVEQVMTFFNRWEAYSEEAQVVIGVERAGVANLGFYLREALRERGRWAIVEDLLPGGRSKFDRIYALEPVARRRKLFYLETCGDWEELLNEFIRFPKARKDDGTDAAAYVLDLLRLYGTPLKEDADENWRLKVQALDPDSRRYWERYHERQAKQVEQGWASEFA